MDVIAERMINHGSWALSASDFTALFCHQKYLEIIGIHPKHFNRTKYVQDFKTLKQDNTDRVSNGHRSPPRYNDIESGYPEGPF